MLKEIVIGNVRIEYCETRGNLPLDMIITFSHKFNKTCRLSPTHTHTHTQLCLDTDMCVCVKGACGMLAAKFAARQIVYNLGLTTTATSTSASAPAPAPR